MGPNFILGSFKLVVLTGRGTDPDQSIFRLITDIWMNLRSGEVVALNATATSGYVYTFDPQYNGQTAEEIAVADSTSQSQVLICLANM